jgi:hypothetical protein
MGDTYCVFVNSHDKASPQNKTPPIVVGLPADVARGLARALNERGYLREGLIALVADLAG